MISPQSDTDRQEVFGHHAQALGAEDLDEIVADYSDDALFITPAGVQRGKDAIREAFSKLLGEVPQATGSSSTWAARNKSLKSRHIGPPARSG